MCTINKPFFLPLGHRPGENFSRVHKLRILKKKKNTTNNFHHAFHLMFPTKLFALCGWLKVNYNIFYLGMRKTDKTFAP